MAPRENAGGLVQTLTNLFWLHFFREHLVVLFSGMHLGSNLGEESDRLLGYRLTRLVSGSLPVRKMGVEHRLNQGSGCHALFDIRC